MMKPEIKQLWVDALRSGFYQKCHRPGHLRDEQACTHCVLGVLTDLYCRSLALPWNDLSLARSQGLLTPSLAEWAELTATRHRSENYLETSRKLYDPMTSRGRLSYLNDDAKLSFSQLADIIEDDL